MGMPDTDGRTQPPEQTAHLVAQGDEFGMNSRPLFLNLIIDPRGNAEHDHEKRCDQPDNQNQSADGQSRSYDLLHDIHRMKLLFTIQRPTGEYRSECPSDAVRSSSRFEYSGTTHAKTGKRLAL